MKRVLTAAIVASLLMGSVASADPRRGDDRGWDRDRGSPTWRHDDRRDRRDSRDYRRDYRYRGDYGPGYHRHYWHRGDRLPSYYRRDVYVIRDYRGYRRLYAPPRGYHWVRTDHDAVLAAIATGVIVGVVVGAFNN
jgi:Ni/Co efflux regulator RcnB